MERHLVRENQLRVLKEPKHRKKISRRRRVVLGVLLGLTLIAISLTILTYILCRPSFSELEDARSALRAARANQAQLYAPGSFAAAEEQLEQACAELRAQNDRFLFTRTYKRAQQLALSAKFQAEEACTQAISVKDSVQADAAASIQAARLAGASFNQNAEGLPLERKLRRVATQSELYLYEAESAFQRGDYFAASKYGRQAIVGSRRATAEVATILQQYSRNKSKWDRWVKETLDWSAEENAYAIVVDKMAHACRVYYNGKLRTTYPVELAPQWMGTKNHRGDGATPEGRYRVTKKKEQSKYYKALAINYPNKEDWARFQQAKKKGVIPKSASVGGLIEIHGSGGRGVDWTLGCIALTNRDMDELFKIAAVGTPVTIVGSLSDFSDKGKMISHPTSRRQRQ